MRFRAFISILVIILCVLIYLGSSCTTNNEECTIVTIDVGLKGHGSLISSILNRVLSSIPLFNTKAFADPPDDITGIAITISGSGMNTIQTTIPVETGILTLEVPSGSARQFQVLAETSSEAYYSGSAQQDLAGGMNVTVSIAMTRYETEPAPTTSSVTISPEYPQGASTNITAYTVTITGADMADVEQSYSSGAITLEVTAGASRSFSLMADVDPDDVGTVKSWSGSEVVDLTAGESISFTIDMSIYETKLVIPDRLYPPNGRLVQVDDMEGNGWTPLSALDIRPYDVELDSIGRIYVADDDNTDKRVIRMDNILRDNSISITCDPPVSGAVRAIAIDRNNNLVYFSDGNNLAISDLDGNNTDGLTITLGVESIQTISGMAVDENGILYIAGTTGVIAPSPRIFRYDPSDQIVTTTYNNTSILNTPWDVIVKPPYAYVANLYGADGYRILQLDLDTLALTGNYGNQASTFPNTDQGEFYNPYRFVAILNEKIYIIDDIINVGNNYDKLISMDDIQGSNWETLPDTGDGQSLFRFYSHC
ncbi:MAG: hypothetical protein SVZ03_10350 [Spirochaetota bacterium]|nr:hypothetical protein [Spirochaetota bacterium]